MILGAKNVIENESENESDESENKKESGSASVVIWWDLDLAYPSVSHVPLVTS